MGLRTGIRPDRRLVRILAMTALVPMAAGCEVEWGGASIALEEPEVPAEADVDGTDPERPEAVEDHPLPEGPLLFLVRGAGGDDVSVVPVARVEEDGLADLGWPESPPAGYAEEFAGSFLEPGTELHLHATGARLGSVVITDVEPAADPGCPPGARGRALLLPNRQVPQLASAVPAGPRAAPPEAPEAPAVTQRIRLFGPILAERLLQEAGVERHFLARPGALHAVRFPGDGDPGMAATYLVGDTLAPLPAAADEAASLFYLARFDPARGYEPVWYQVHRYAPDGKVAYDWLDWAPAERPGTLALVRRMDPDGIRLAAARLPEPDGVGDEPVTAEPRWVEPPSCPVLERLLPDG